MYDWLILRATLVKLSVETLLFYLFIPFNDKSTSFMCGYIRRVGLFVLVAIWCTSMHIYNT